MRCFFNSLAAVLLGCGTLMNAAGQDQQALAYPEKVVKVIVPYGAGGAADILVRIVSTKLAQMWKQQVIVENRVGAVGAIGITAAARSDPDGYTLVSIPVSNLSVNPHLYKKLPYSVDDDLAPVVLVGSVGNVFVANPTRYKTIGDVLEAAKHKTLTYSSPGVGSQAHLGGAMFERAAKVKLLHVPYNGVQQALLDVMTGQVDFMVAQLPAVIPHLGSGRLVALAMADDQRSEFLPNVQTLREAAGLSIGRATSWSGIFAPTKTPIALRRKIAADVTAALNAPEVKAAMANSFTTPGGGTPEDLARAMKTDSEKYGEVIRAAGISLD